MAPSKPVDTSPTEAEAWRALISHEDELEDYKLPGALKNAMLEILTRSWKKAFINVPLGPFSQLWRDRHYRAIVSKIVATGPGSATFESETYRRLKSSRLEGYWDVLLEGFADWIESFAKSHKLLVTLEDSQNLVACLDEDGENPVVYEENLNGLFWNEAEPDKPLSRSSSFLLKLSDAAYTTAYEVLLTNPPKLDWDLENLLSEIHLRSQDCKPLMLHVCFWFNPDLVEPANRAENKEPLFYHLKPSFSRFKPTQPSYDNDESWKPEAIALQRVVIDFILEYWETVKFEDRYCRDPHQHDPKNPYSARFKNRSWHELVDLVRNNTTVPFKHPDLIAFNRDIKDQTPSNGRSKRGKAKAQDVDSRMIEEVNNIIAAEYGDDPVVHEKGIGSARSKASLSSSPSSSHSGEEYDSALEEVPEDSTKRLQKRKASVLKEERDGDGGRSPSQRPSKVIRLRMPPEWVSASGPRTTLVVKPSNGQDADPPATQADNRRVSFSSPRIGAIPSPNHGPNTSVPTNMVNNPPSFVAVNTLSGANTNGVYSNGASANIHIAPANSTRPNITVPLSSQRQTISSPPRTSIRSDMNIDRITNPDRQEPSPIVSAPSRSASMATENPAPTSSISDMQRIAMAAESVANRTSSPAASSSRRVPAHAIQSERSYRILPPPPEAANYDASGSSSLPSYPRSASGMRGAAPVSKTKTEQAIILLENEYSEKLQIHEMLKAITMVKNDQDAGIFLTLTAGRLRDAWLMESIRNS